jgi:hypothetical protein
MHREAAMDAERNLEIPSGMRDGDVLVYMSGRLLVVDHLVPEAFTIDLVELQAADGQVRPRREPAG